MDVTWAETYLKKHIEEDLGLEFDKDALYDKFLAIDTSGDDRIDK